MIMVSNLFSYYTHRLISVQAGQGNGRDIYLVYLSRKEESAINVTR